MQYPHLGRSGLRVSKLCLGTMNFGPYTTEADSFGLMDQALDYGINFFDTANIYGVRIPPMPDQDPGYPGHTEEILGKWFAQGGGRREKVVLATKAYADMAEWPNNGKLSALNIKRACEASLRRMGTDYIDLYQMHHIDRATPWEEIWQAMEQLRREGKVLYVGSSNFAGWHIATANQEAQRRQMMGLVSEQSLYNLNARTIELEVVPACAHYGLGIMPWSPLAGGLLGGVLAKARAGRRTSPRIQHQLQKFLPRIESWEALCSEWGQPPGDVALAWVMAQPQVVSTIIGPRTAEQLEDALRAMALALPQDISDRLDDIFPGPGGAAPEAYAW